MLTSMNDKGGYARLAWLSHRPLAGTVMMERLSHPDDSAAEQSSPHKARFMLPS
ncbi:hypothetical protein [Burkholderia cepacia]|uniref:hypothetical protein n=1 Tax=Burkholderia cepacia TaxID=292 RepID=UPI000A58493A|nr:hypothetical protein [Burkholderia cepacia]